MSERFSPEYVEQAWANVRSHRPMNSDLKVLELDLQVAGGRVLLGTDGAGFRRILFPLGPGGPCDSDTRSVGVGIIRSELIDGGSRRSYVEVECRRPGLNDLFSSITAEILNLVDDDISRPDVTAGSVLSRWRSLLRAEATRGLDRARAVGLLGELIVLEEIAGSGHVDVAAWTGPNMLRHDFTLPEGSLEVKSTTAQAGWDIEIHGQYQLEAPPSGDLYLVGVRFEISPEGDRFLADQIRRLVCAGIDESDLWESLNLIDVYETPYEDLENFKFFLRDITTFLVEDDFPRISADMFKTEGFPERINGLRYSVNLNGMPSVDFREALSSVGGKKGCDDR